MKRDWYLNKTWNSSIENEFETRLKRSRGSYNKAQYLRIQSSCLLDSSNLTNQIVGIKLMERMINEFPFEETVIVFGQEQLGDYYLRISDFNNAEKYFTVVRTYCENKKSRSWTSGIFDLKLAKAFLFMNNSEKLKEAYAICVNYPINELTFNSKKYYYAELFAHICYQLRKIDEAHHYANIAIQLSQMNEPQFPRHKTVGLVNATSEQIKALEKILNCNS